VTSVLAVTQEVARLTFCGLLNELGESDVGPELSPACVFPEGGHVVVCQLGRISDGAGGDGPGFMVVYRCKE
jgi:hypothetical protein